MGRKKFLIVSAGGKGVRMGGSRPKQFLEFEGVPVLRLTISKFLEAVPDIRVVTVLPESWIPWWKDYCLENNFNCPQVMVAGGITRFHSVKNALAKVPDGAIVAVHDGVRPLISKELIVSMFERMEKGSCHGLVPCRPTTDTLKPLHTEVGPDGEKVLALTEGVVLDRSSIYSVQTPQIFLSEELKAAYGQAYDTSFTDDASVASAYGIPLSFCEGERFNIKLTTPEDLELARAIRIVGKTI